MKQKLLYFVLVSMLALSNMIPILSAKSNGAHEKIKDVSTDDCFTGIEINVDVSAVLKELGYTEETMGTAPRKLIIQILRSYDAPVIRDDNGEYYVTITPDSPRAEVNLIGTDRTVAYELDLPNPPDYSGTYYNSSKMSSGLVMDVQYPNQRACLVFAIWDYPGTDQDVPTAQGIYNEITGWINSVDPYDYTNYLTNTNAEHEDIWNWITWATAVYGDVDVYWIGHGNIVGGDVGFVSYDGWSDAEGWLDENYYYEEDFETNVQYDYSSLRLGFGSFCFGEGFSDAFLNISGDITHDRAYLGTTTLLSIAYADEFIDTWGEEWYDNYDTTGWAWADSVTATTSLLPTGLNHIWLYDDDTFHYDD